MKKTIINTKYIWLLFILIGFSACNDPEDILRDNNVDPVTGAELPELISGSADFSNYVALGASFTAGYTDGAVFIASQENSFPNIIAKEFAKAGSASFTQPLVSDNFGGLAIGGTRIANPRLVFGGAGPVSIESIIGPVTVSTDIALNNPTGPFNNLGVPGAKSFHLLANGYGNIANFPAAANPYAVRMTGSTPDASIIELAMAQNPTFFTLSEIGGNDVLGYATSGGDGSNPITDTATFDFAFTTLVTTLTSGGAKGVVTNVPYITDLPHFTTVPHNPLSPNNPSFGPLIPTLNGIFGQINQVFAFLQVPERSIVFSTTEASAVVIRDETLTDLSAQITGVFLASPTFPLFVQSLGLPAQAAPLVATLLGNAYGQVRQATADDLFVLPSSSVIGTVNTASMETLMSFGLSPELAGQFSAEGITYPLEDKWVLLPTEQAEIKAATDAYNTTIESVAASNSNVALVDLNAILDGDGILETSGNFTLTTSLVTGGAVSLDGIHLTARGYAYMANAFFKAIDATFGSNFEASGNVANLGDYPTNYSPLLQ
jgi:lysophospholipase L1-like esterase